MKTGVYENLIYTALERKLQSLPDNLEARKMNIDKPEASKFFTNYLSHLLSSVLSDDRFFDNELIRKIEFVNKMVRYIENDWNPDWKDDLIVNGDKLLSGIIDKTGLTPEQIKKRDSYRPVSGFTVSSLFTGSNSDLNIGEEIKRDILSADRIFWLVSFIRFSGVRIFLRELSEFLSRSGTELYIITTSYMGASEPKAVEMLQQLNPEKVHIKVTYDCTLDRLHAKSYIFERNSGLSTAYIGSSNLSKSALDKGLEWNIRVTSQENPHIIKAALASFLTYWNRDDFEPFDASRFRRAIEENNHLEQRKTTVLQKYIIRPEQKKILDDLSVERKVHNSFRNLIVAATGTGKTVVAAFDYRRFALSHPGHARLLFIAHHVEILQQSRRTFASVMQDSTFGEVWGGQSKPSLNGNLEHLFLTIETFIRNVDLFKNFGSDFYDFIIIDECHHSQANSYRPLFSIFHPQILLGLTATPERADGKSLLPDFNNRIAAEIRLPEAINRLLLVPFQYFCIADETADLSHALWSQGNYDDNDLLRRLNTEDRMTLISQKIPQYIADEHRCHALCFCINRRHARDTADGLQRMGYQADYLTGEDSAEKRKRVTDDFRTGKINYLCVVDIFNEGVDIPEIDTILFLRPTKSLTIFIQQLGRGLRLAPDKDCLTVLDFVAQANQHYNFESRIRALTGPNNHNMKDSVKNGFTMLPRGCDIVMEPKAQSFILQSITKAIFNKQRLVREVTNYHLNFTDELTLGHFLDHFSLDPEAVYKVMCWTSLLKTAGVLKFEEDAYTKIFEKSMANFLHLNSLSLIQFIKHLLVNNFEYVHNDCNRKFALITYYNLFGRTSIDRLGFTSIDKAFQIFLRYPLFVAELQAIMNYLEDHLNVQTEPIEGLENVPLELFSRYTRAEHLILFGQMNEKSFFNPQAGIYGIEDKNTELMWVTLNKSDKDFSPSTQYDDYAINSQYFQWQSQNSASQDNNSGKRYIQQKDNHRKFLLFVRQQKADGYGFTEPFYCLGLVDFVSCTGNRPMTITWRMHHEIPVFLLDMAQKQAVG